MLICFPALVLAVQLTLCAVILIWYYLQLLHIILSNKYLDTIQTRLVLARVKEEKMEA